MRFRTFAWIAAATVLIGVNTSILLWLRADRGAGSRAGRGGAAPVPRRVPETPEPYRPADAAAVERATAAGARLRVEVVTASGEPIAGAAVRVTGDRPGSWSPFPVEALAGGTTAGDGVVEFELARRVDLRVAVRREGFAPAEVPTAAAGVRVVLRPEAALRVRVVDDATGAPRPGLAIVARHRVPISGSPAPPAEGTTLGDGAVLLRGLRTGRWSLSLAEGGRPLGEADAAEGEERTFEVRLRPPFLLRGRVVVPGFDRVVGEGSVATGFGEPLLRGASPHGPAPAAIGADGRFALPLEGPPGSPYFLRVETGGQAYRVQGQAPALDPATGQQAGEIQVPIPGNNPDASFSGTVRDEAGRPVPGALVLLGSGLPSTAARWMRSEVHLDEAWTDATGAWRALPRYPGTTCREALVLHPEFAPRLVEIPTRMRTRRVDAVLEPGVSAVVTVRDASHGPVAGAEVSAQMRHPRPDREWIDFGDVHGAIRAWPRTGDDGVAALPRLGTGSWYLRARGADGREGGCVLVEVRPGSRDLQVAIGIAPLPVVRGTVRVRDPAVALPAGSFLLVPGEGVLSWIRVPVDASGRFESPPLLIPPSLLVDGRVPVHMPEIAGPGALLGLAEPGAPIEIEVDPP